MECCFGPAAQTLLQIAADPKHLGAEIGFSPSYTLGARLCIIIPMSIASSLEEGSHWIIVDGFPAEASSFCPSKC